MSLIFYSGTWPEKLGGKFQPFKSLHFICSKTLFDKKMNLLLKFALAFLSVAYFVCGEIELDGDVLVLDDSNFEEAKTTYDKLLVEFYAPW